MTISTMNNNDKLVLEKAKTGVVIYNLSSWGRIRISDSDRLRFLHNQSTNDFQSLKPGQGCDTVLVTSTARTIDLATGYVLDDAVLLLVSPNRREFLLQWLDRYIFFADQVTLTDVTENTVAFSIIGDASHSVIEKLGAGSLIGQPYGNHILVDGIIMAVGSGLVIPGYTVILSKEQEKTWLNKILDLGIVELSDGQWEMLRILQGRPAPERELTDDYNPLEVGLWQTISFNKGCYIGQETIARLNTYKGIKQYLWGIKLSDTVEPGTVITIGEEKIGKLTSYTLTPDGHFGLGYIKSKAGGIGLQVTIGGITGEVVSLPFVSHEYP
ncbi:folate-binding protein YgfZ [Anabaena sp. FACHB-1237]|uniref:CAF17-like 4Fe-4S cluster assembly/insertion protein YgfZ n=1 Tax=Anabaena sp. FACHB-1237 TaxID=2692769 RepID=UPI00167FFF4D|nr:folate-binding protein YgfZ [Anabaena sp. FACHB-1237]MBD2136600.1 folate-binding protein YgfZ [Anabaena sp. FACHB-1237]